MKKTLLLLALSLVCFYTHAQKVDTTLLYGKWEMYSMKSAAFTYCRDSLAQNLEALIRRRKTDNPKQASNSNDSLKLLNKATADVNDMFKSYITFDKMGHSVVLDCENGVCTEKPGTYSWSGENKFTKKTGDNDPQVFVILELTTKELTIKSEDNDNGRAITMTLTRAK